MGLAERLHSTGMVSDPGIVIPETKQQEADQLDDLRTEVQAHLIETLGQQLYSGEIEVPRLERMVIDAIQTVLARESRPLSGSDRARVVQDILDDVLGNGPLEPLLRDPEVTEIMVNRFDTIYMEKFGRIHKTGLRFGSERHLRRTIDRIVSQVGRRIDEASPMVDARLPDGSRVNAVIPPIALDGASLTIRKFAVDPYTASDLITMGTLTRQATELLQACVRGKLNILISGGTGSGKTTTLNVLSSFIPADERIVTVEDAAELQLSQPHVVRLESRPPNVEGQGTVTIRDLVRNCLRMRPDRIVVGEVRDAASLDMLQAMNTGHEGSLSTIHANSPRDALSRLETMILMADLDLPVTVIREQMSSAIDVVVHQMRLRDGSRHVTQISEVMGRDGTTVVMQDLFTFEYSHKSGTGSLGRLTPTGIVPGFKDRLLDRGVSLPSDIVTV